MAAPQQDADRKQQCDWLYPELMAKEGLLDILRQRYVSHPDIERLEKEELVELYYKYVIPLPQRKYRMNRRGREMTRKQILLAKKRKITAPDDTEPVKKKQYEDSTVNSRLISSFNDPSKGERLKPPPSCIDFNKKTIKLGSGPKSSPTQDNVTKGESDSQSESPKKKIKLITFSSSEKTSALSNKGKSPAISSPVTSPTKMDISVNKTKTVCLINKHLTSPDPGIKDTPKTSPEKLCASPDHDATIAKRDGDTEKKSAVTSTSKKKIKIARIPWP
ncbi:ashwin-like [Ylistrum balloti]|uniref:ashwin-like n=1 Tax=Ylistrum balloti TaxID=509963 RepID=UPI002905C1EB|nr:ashwin-like [Ylistrum balloti]